MDHLALVYPKLRQTELWSEVAIIKRIVYKHGNQHRKQFYFQGLRRVRYFYIFKFKSFNLNNLNPWWFSVHQCSKNYKVCMRNFKKITRYRVGQCSAGCYGSMSLWFLFCCQVVKSLDRLQEIGIYYKLTDVRNSFVRYVVLCLILQMAIPALISA